MVLRIWVAGILCDPGIWQRLVCAGGTGGQYIFVVPELDMVCVMTAYTMSDQDERGIFKQNIIAPFLKLEPSPKGAQLSVSGEQLLLDDFENGGNVNKLKGT